MYMNLPCGFEIKIFKWFIVPAILLFLLIGAYSCDSRARQCSELCEERGYVEYDIYPGRYGERTSCVLRGKIRSDGTVDKSAKETIYLTK